MKVVRPENDPLTLTLWCEVDTDRSEIFREFEFIGTGQKAPDDAEYVDTFFLGNFVFHLYELIAPRMID